MLSQCAKAAEDLCEGAGPRGMVSSTRLHDVYAIRLCVLSHSTTEADVLEVLRLLESA